MPRAFRRRHRQQHQPFSESKITIKERRQLSETQRQSHMQVCLDALTALPYKALDSEFPTLSPLGLPNSDPEAIILICTRVLKYQIYLHVPLFGVLQSTRQQHIMTGICWEKNCCLIVRNSTPLQQRSIVFDHTPTLNACQQPDSIIRCIQTLANHHDMQVAINCELHHG